MSRTLTIANDLIENPSPRCPCMVVLDTSGSMGGAPIQQLNDGFQQFLQTLQEDEVASCSVEVAVITAGAGVTEQLPFTTAMDIDHCARFTAGGATPLGQAIELALTRLHERKAKYRSAGVAYFQPWLVIISDGSPTDYWRTAAHQAKQLSSERKLVSLAIGVQGASMETLSEFSHRPAIMLDGLKFEAFFEWLSASMSRVSSSASTTASVTLPSMDGWASI